LALEYRAVILFQLIEYRWPSPIGGTHPGGAAQALASAVVEGMAPR
jgi:hypothetical protein